MPKLLQNMPSVFPNESEGDPEKSSVMWQFSTPKSSYFPDEAIWNFVKIVLDGHSALKTICSVLSPIWDGKPSHRMNGINQFGLIR